MSITTVYNNFSMNLQKAKNFNNYSFSLPIYTYRKIYDLNIGMLVVRCFMSSETSVDRLLSNRSQTGMYVSSANKQHQTHPTVMNYAFDAETGLIRTLSRHDCLYLHVHMPNSWIVDHFSQFSLFLVIIYVCYYFSVYKIMEQFKIKKKFLLIHHPFQQYFFFAKQ